MEWNIPKISKAYSCCSHIGHFQFGLCLCINKIVTFTLNSHLRGVLSGGSELITALVLLEKVFLQQQRRAWWVITQRSLDEGSDVELTERFCCAGAPGCSSPVRLLCLMGCRESEIFSPECLLSLSWWTIAWPKTTAGHGLVHPPHRWTDKQLIF